MIMLKDRVFIKINHSLYNSYVIHNLLMVEYFNNMRTLKIGTKNKTKNKTKNIKCLKILKKKVTFILLNF